jgi:hypothetical protein
LDFYKTKHSRMGRYWHVLMSAALFLLAAAAGLWAVWHFWWRTG